MQEASGDYRLHVKSVEALVALLDPTERSKLTLTQFNQLLEPSGR